LRKEQLKCTKESSQYRHIKIELRTGVEDQRGLSKRRDNRELSGCNAEGKDLTAMLKEDLFAERIAIESYSEIARWLGNDDTTTQKMIEEILKVEEEHAGDLKSLLDKMA
jgi:rubrerythrin